METVASHWLQAKKLLGRGDDLSGGGTLYPQLGALHEVDEVEQAEHDDASVEMTL